jgi:hypothetical protein
VVDHVSEYRFWSSLEVEARGGICEALGTGREAGDSENLEAPTAMSARRLLLVKNMMYAWEPEVMRIHTF